jgi:hypothetical protein
MAKTDNAAHNQLLVNISQRTTVSGCKCNYLKGKPNEIFNFFFLINRIRYMYIFYIHVYRYLPFIEILKFNLKPLKPSFSFISVCSCVAFLYLFFQLGNAHQWMTRYFCLFCFSATLYLFNLKHTIIAHCLSRTCL